MFMQDSMILRPQRNSVVWGWKIRSAVSLLKVFVEFLVLTSKWFSSTDFLKHETSSPGHIHFSRNRSYYSVYKYKDLKRMTLQKLRVITWFSEDLQNTRLYYNLLFLPPAPLNAILNFLGILPI